LMTGPGSPSVLSNVIRSIEQHVDWVTKCLTDLREHGLATIEATPQAQDDWVAHVKEVAQKTLFVKTPSWYSGADIPGKPKVFAPYAGGLPQYRDKVEGVAREGYVGFSLK
jgi:cyclohexanone monooxygenase